MAGKVFFNNEAFDILENENIVDFFERNKINLNKWDVVVYNGNPVKKENLNKVILRDNDKIDIVGFFGGG